MVREGGNERGKVNKMETSGQLGSDSGRGCSERLGVICFRIDGPTEGWGSWGIYPAILIPPWLSLLCRVNYATLLGCPRRLLQPENACRKQFLQEFTGGDLHGRPWGCRLGTDSFCKAYKISPVLCKALVPLRKRFQKQKSCQDLCCMNGEDIGGGRIEF